MRSAYGLTIPGPNTELTHVGPGTPCGELMRRYWHPVCLSSELKDLPKRVMILGEDLVVFRDGNGRVGLFFYLCSHRATSLEYGRIERDGLRCCYHGWLYDVNGRVIDMPLEAVDSPLRRSNVEHPCYPSREFGGLVFAYMGPSDKIPPFPVYDILLKEDGVLTASIGPRVGGAVNCNWLQSQENLMDVLHTQWLHTKHSIPQFPSKDYGIMPAVKYEDTELGMRAVMTRALPAGQEWDVVWEMIGANVFVLFTDEPQNARARSINYCIPIDDTHHWAASINWSALGQNERYDNSGRMAMAPASRKDTSYEYTQRFPDDKEAQEGQGPIAIHKLERLGTSDKGVIMFRRMIRRGIDAVAKGEDPIGVIRDPAKARCVPTSAGSAMRANSQLIA